MEIAKRHPYLVGGGVILAIGAYLLLSSSGSSTGSGNDLGNIYTAQAAADTANRQIDAQLAGQENQLGAQLTGLTIQTQSAKDLATINQQTELAKIGAAQEITDLANTLTANVAMKNIQGQVDITAINADVSKTQYNNLANVLIEQTRSNAAITQAALSKKSCGLFSIFTGC